MERITLTSGNVEECASRAAEVLRAGGVVLYPTDTLYGLGGDALSDTAVANICSIKGRDEGKPVHAIVADMAMAEKFGNVTQHAQLLAKKFGGKVTLVVKKVSEVDTGIARGISTFGFRIPDNEFCIALTRSFGGPVTATSANTSGLPSARRVDDILAQLGASAEKIDLVIDAGELPERKPSTVVDLSGAGPDILREGAVPAAEIRALLD